MRLTALVFALLALPLAGHASDCTVRPPGQGRFAQLDYLGECVNGFAHGRGVALVQFPDETQDDIQAHHLIEQRFSTVIGQNIDEMLAIVVTRAEHVKFTNMWRQAFPYGAATVNATRDQVIAAARNIYKNYPAILQALGI